MGNDHSKIAASQLPEEIIHHIQSFMSERDAAQTTLLSKSWYGAWFTRPTLNFSEYQFPYDKFEEITKKTMQRYEDHNLSIQTLLLWMHGETCDSLARELILRAIKLGATDLTIHVPTPFVLPDEVLESQTLTRLSLIRLTVNIRNREITYSKLKFLSLDTVTVKGDLLRDLISRCPSIQELTMNRITSLFGCKTSLVWPKLPCLKELVIEISHFDRYEWKSIKICSPSLEHIYMYVRTDKALNLEFDVPNIRQFLFRGYPLPHVEIKTSSSREWKSDIRTSVCQPEPPHPSASWFSSLHQLLKALSLSRVSLRLGLYLTNSDYGALYVGDGLDIPQVEILHLGGCQVTSSFMDALFWCCRPNFVYVGTRRPVVSMNAHLIPPSQPLPWKKLLDVHINKQDSTFLLRYTSMRRLKGGAELAQPRVKSIQEMTIIIITIIFMCTVHH